MNNSEPARSILSGSSCVMPNSAYCWSAGMKEDGGASVMRVVVMLCRHSEPEVDKRIVGRTDDKRNTHQQQ